MRILHTADWHLGRVFQQVNLLEDQAAILGQILDHIEAATPDLVIIAGDIFDRANPRREAIEVFSDFLQRFRAKSTAALVVIAGNHDSGELISYGGVLNHSDRTLIHGVPAGSSRPLILADDHGKVAISALPYMEIFTARRYFSAEQAAKLRSPQDVLKAQIEAARAKIPAQARWIITAHTFVQGGRASQSERSLDLIGGIETVSSTVFHGADYVALGHLHRAQAIGSQHIRYAGSIMRYGFDEVDIGKSITLVELDGKGAVEIEELPLTAPRGMRVIEGTFDQVLNQPAPENRNDFIKFSLFDRNAVPDAMNRLRQIYPNAVQLEWVNQQPQQGPNSADPRRAKHRRPHELIADFFADVVSEPLQPEIQKRLEKYAATLTRARS